MKMYFILPLLLTIFSLHAAAQRSDTALFKGATKIIIKNDLKSADNFQLAGKGLLNVGYMIASKDQQFGQLISEPFKTDYGQEIIYVVVKDNEIDITAKTKSDDAIQLVSWAKHENSFKPVIYSKHNLMNAEYFDYMIKFAKSLSMANFIYSE
jgi:hypothetical protein